MPENIRTLQRREIIVNGYALPQITEEQLANWSQNLTYVSYLSYGFNMDGELVPISDENLIRDAYRSGIAPLMVLTPFDETGAYSYNLVRKVFTDPRMRDRLINNIVLTATDKNYYGVVFNFGYIAAEDNSEFVITVSKSAARLNRRGKLIIVSIIAGLNDEGIDYESLGRAANLIELRTFRWEQSQSPPASISPIDRVRETISAVTALVDPRFILISLPNFGFDWALPFVQGSTIAEMISNIEAEGRADRTGTPVQFDETAQSPHFNYINGIGTAHEVWFDNVRSMRARLELVEEYNLAGVSIWTIMNPFPAGIQALNEQFDVISTL